MNNHSVAYLSTDEELHAYEDIFIDCQPYLADLPGTGIFDSTISRIILGVLLVGMGYAYYRFGLIDNTINWFSKTVSDGTKVVSGKAKHTFGRGGQRDRYERRMVKKADKKRKKSR